MRSDTELFKDKIEISLDGRQIFYLFFGGAVLASLVFVLGVMVGRRVEARAHVDNQPATSAVLDPLAALDELARRPVAMAEDERDEGQGSGEHLPESRHQGLGERPGGLTPAAGEGGSVLRDHRL